MGLNCRLTSRYKKDLKSYKHNKDILKELAIVIEMLINGITLPEKYNNHMLTGNYKGNYDCHIKPDDILIYKITNNELILVRFGSHNKLELTETISKRSACMKLTIKESFSNYDIEEYLCRIEDKWGLWLADKMLDWLVDHSDNAEDIFEEQGAYDIEQFEYWVGNETIEKVMLNCLETGRVEEV